MMDGLPHNWEKWFLADVGEWLGGGTPSSSNDAYWKGDIPWVSPKDMKVAVITSTQDKITKAAIENSAAKLIPARAVLFVTRSGILAHSFPVATNRDPVTINQDLKAIVPVSAIDHKYLAWALRCFERTVLTSCSKYGTTVHSIEMPALKSFKVPIPPLNEQHRIVAKIEELFSELDKGVEVLTTAREQLKAYRLSVLSAALSGALTRVDSRAWPRYTIGQLITEIRYGTARKCTVDPSKTPVLRIPNVAGGRIDLSNLKHTDFDTEELEKLRLEAGDILIVRSNGSVSLVGLSAVVTERAVGFAYAGYLIRLRIKKEKVLPEFLNMCLHSLAVRADIERHARSTSGVHNINSDEIRAISLRIPPLGQQREIVTVLTEKWSHADASETCITTELQRSAALRQSILKQTFSGQLVAQDPTDEPALVLLERIRAERKKADAKKQAARQRELRTKRKTSHEHV